MLLPGSNRGGVAPESSNMKSCTYDEEEYHLRSVTLDGSRVEFLRGTADLDKRQISNSQPFKLYRRSNRQPSFGEVPNLGFEAHLAPSDARIALQTLLDSSGELALLGLSTHLGSRWARACDRVELAPPKGTA